MTTNIRTARLLDWLEGRLDTMEEQALEAALATAAPEVQQRLSWVREFHSLAGRTVVENPPPELRDRLILEFRAARGVRLAEIIFDSRRDAVGVRSDGDGDRWSQVHTSDLLDLATDYIRDGDRIRVSGQVLLADVASVGSVELVGDGPETIVRYGRDVIAESEVDELGQFTLGLVEPGAYKLVVFHNDGAVTVAVGIEP